MTEVNLSQAAAQNTAQIERLEDKVGMKLHDCYQCGKCTAGCPMAESMDVMPRQILRLLQLGLLEEALHAKAPWICATCSTCSTRCPHDVKIAEMMEAVRMEADRRGIHPVRRVDLFTNDFMIPVKQFGRTHELTMTAFYNLTSGRVFQHFSYLPKMLKGGKLRIIPEMVKGRAHVKRIIENCEKEAAKQ